MIWSEIGVEQGDGDTSSVKGNACPPYSPSLSSSLLRIPLLSSPNKYTSHHHFQTSFISSTMTGKEIIQKMKVPIPLF